MGVLKDCQRVVKESLEGLGGLDIIVSNAVCSLSLQMSKDAGRVMKVGGLDVGDS